MVSGSGSPRGVVLPLWIRPFHQCWKPLTWIWGGLLLSIFINIGSSWLIAKTLDLSGTPLAWGLDHPWITLPSLLLLLLFTLLARLAFLLQQVISPTSPFTMTPKQRLQFIGGLEQEYTSRLASSLQGQLELELCLEKRTDVIASANLVFPHLQTSQHSPLSTETSIIQAYDRASRGLLILGAPGSGKTTLLLSLARELLHRAESDPDQPLSLILNLSSWAKTQSPLAQWLSEQCSLVYGIPKRMSVSWIAQEQVQFLLDGLDEMGALQRTACIQAINTYRQTHLVPLVVCSRLEEYEVQQARLILPVAVEIQALSRTQVIQVLGQGGRSLAAVRTALRRSEALGDLLTTPLWLSIVTLTYRGKNLKDLPQTGSPGAQQRVILEQYVGDMLHRYQQRRRFSLAQTTSSLVWLAQQMQQRQMPEFYLEALQVDWLNTRRTSITYWLIYMLLVGLGFGLVFGLGIGLGVGLNVGPGFGLGIGLLGRLGIGLIFGLVFGLVAGLLGKLKGIGPVERFTWSWKVSGMRLFFGLVFGLVFGLIYGLLFGPVNGLINGLFSGLGAWLLGGLFGTPMSQNVRLKPNQGIHTSGWNALRLGFVFFLLYELFSWMGVRLGSGPLIVWVGILIDGLLVGIGIGLLAGGAACCQYYLLRLFLAHSRALPWRAIPFLEEAVVCILLQRVGGGYRFVHPLLQEYFASMNSS